MDDNSFNFVWLNTLKFNPLVRLPEFLMGAAAGVLFLRSSVSRKWATALILASIAGFALVVGLSPWIPYPLLHDSILPPAFAVLIYGMALRPKWLGFMEVKPLILLGDASYSLYLLHATLIGMYFMPEGKVRELSIWGILLGLLIPIVVAILVYLLVEQPARRWLRPQTRKAEPAQAMAVAEA